MLQLLYGQLQCTSYTEITSWALDGCGMRRNLNITCLSKLRKPIVACEESAATLLLLIPHT
jgi:hypothetical protein